MRIVVVDDYQTLLEDLRVKTAASRTTLRLARPDKDYPVASEALADGTPSIFDVESVQQRDADTTSYIRREMRTLMVGDIMAATPRPPAEMISEYGLRAFMMCPLARKPDGELEGWISVHSNTIRNWSPEDRNAIEFVADAVQRSLDLQRCIDDLRADLGASRCTLRQDIPGDYDYPVTHEAVADGVNSIKSYRNLPQLGSPTFERIGRTRTLVVQNDCQAAATGGDPEYSVDYQLKLNADYGNMSAFIAAPVYVEEHLQGVISIHQTDRPREWSKREISRAERAVETVASLLRR